MFLFQMDFNLAHLLQEITGHSRLFLIYSWNLKILMNSKFEEELN